jgi:hypothetical protein
MVSKYESQFMELLRYALHLSTKKMKVNKFLFGLNFNIRVKVRILISHTLHDAVYKALIVEEELTSGGQGKTSTRPTRQTKASAQQHHTLARHTPRYHDMSRGSTFMTPR